MKIAYFGWRALVTAVTVSLFVFLAYGAADKQSDGPTNKEGWVSLFDGESFEGWEGNLNFFRIEDSAVVAGTLIDRIPRNEFLCTTAKYGDFELRLKFKAIGEGVNGGIQLRTHRIPNHHEVSGYQADIGQGYWGALYDESRRNKVLAGPDKSVIERILRVDDWNEYRIRCEGPHIQLWLNGVKTVDYVEQDAAIPKKGIIGLQIHSGPPAEVWYKDILIRPISDE